MVLTFVMCIGIVFRMTDLLARGVSWHPVLRVFLCGLPATLLFSLPISALTTSLLVFGRLSADGEITAMKASGISMWQIASRPLLISVVSALVCLYIGSEFAPRSHMARRTMVARLGVETPSSLLEEGRFIQDFQGLTLYIEKKKGKALSGVRIYDLRDKGVKREVLAKSGEISPAGNKTDILINLYGVRVDPFSADKRWPVRMGKWTVRIEDALKVRTYKKRQDDMTMLELIDGIRHVADHFPHLDKDDLLKQKMSYTVEFNKRLVLSIACLAFVLLGVPLGIRAHRKESSIGIAISLSLVFNFYLFIIVAESLAKQPVFRPDIICWLPILISVTLGCYMVRRAN